MPAASFAKTSAPLAFNKADGICYGWLCYSHKGGEAYVDLHGDHFPAEELRKAAEDAMSLPSSERLINVGHAGGARGEVIAIYPLIEDIAKAQGIDTGGDYGLVCSFRPDAALLAEIVKGKQVCLSIEGTAGDVEIVKSAEGIAATAHKRTMRKVKLGKFQFAAVDAGAHEGASVAVIKAAIKAARIAKACPAMTSPTNGHAHLIADCDEDAGYTSSEPMSGQPDSGWHSHPWLKDEATGAITIGEALGHSHTVNPTDDTAETDMPTADDLAKTQADLTSARAAITKIAGLLGAAVALTPDQAAFAKRLEGDKLEAFLGLPEAERVAKATPVHVGSDGTRYFASDDARLVTLAKSADAQGAELAKAREATAAVAFEKRAAAELGHVPGTVDARAFILKAIDATPGDAEVKKAALAVLAAADKSFATVFKTVGVGGNADPVVKTAQEELDGITAEIAKTQGVTFAKASDLALDTPRGRQLYNEIERAKRNA